MRNPVCSVVSQDQAEDKGKGSVGVCQSLVVFILFIVLYCPHTPSSCLPHPVNMNYRLLFSVLFTPRYFGKMSYNKSVI